MSRRFSILVLLFFSVAFAEVNGAESVDQAAAARPHTCLVLSGGGARGAAHVGALKVLEELRIPVDCVVGTSVGSIVGGLYSSGLAPQALEVIFRTIDWEAMFEDAPNRRQISFRQKEDDLLPLFPLEVGLGWRGFSAPAGLIAGQKLSFILRGLTLHTLAQDDFDDLRIPFRAVAADLSDGSMVVLGRGALADAIRASMAVPGVFRPIRKDGRTLVDGGVSRNLPVSVAQDMGAMRVIAIDIGTPPREVVGDESLVEVVTQTMSVLSDQNVRDSKALLQSQDILIEPDLGDIGTADFDRLVEAMEIGEVAVRQQADSLKAMTVSVEEYAQFLARQRLPAAEALAAIRIDAVEAVGSERVDPRQIRQRIRTRAGDYLDLGTLREDLERLYQMGDFEQVDFRLLDEGDGKRLLIDTRDKAWGPGYLRPGLTLASDLGGESEFLAMASYRRTQLNSRGAEWKTLLSTGDVNGLFTEFFQPLDFKGFFFVAPFLDWRRDKFLDATARAGGVRLTTRRLGLELGVQLKNYAEFTVGIETGTTRTETQLLGSLSADLGGVRLSFVLDQIDNTFFPHHGGLATLDVFRSSSDLGAEDLYDRLEASVLQAWTVGQQTLLGRVRYGSSLGSDLPVYEAFELGGIANLSGLQPGQLRGDSMALASLTYYRHFGRYYAGGSVEGGNVWPGEEDVDLGDFQLSGLVFLARETFLGPAIFGYGSSEEGEDSFYFLLGRLF